MALTNLATTPAGFLGALVSSDLRPHKAKKEEDHILRIFDLVGGRCIKEFPVLWDGGGRRVAFSRDGKTIYVGCYNVHGLACYSVDTGKELWRRKDLKGVQAIYVCMTQDQVFCEREGACPLLKGATGETFLLPRGVKAVWFSPFGDIALIEKGKQAKLEIHQPLGNQIGKFPRGSFCVNGAAFSEDVLLLKEPTANSIMFVIMTAGRCGSKRILSL